LKKYFLRNSCVLFLAILIAGIYGCGGGTYYTGGDINPTPSPTPVIPTPQISGISPDSLLPGSQVTISGSGFGGQRGIRDGGQSYVSFMPTSGGNGLRVQNYGTWNDTKIICTVPPLNETILKSASFVAVVTRVASVGTFSSATSSTGKNMVTISPPVGWAAGDSDGIYGTILYTNDAGNTWVRQGSAQQIPDSDISDICAIDTKNAWAVGTNDGNVVILRTTDGGENWQRQGTSLSLDRHLSGITYVDSNTAWAVGEKGTILFTNDGGTNWTQQNIGASTDVLYQGITAFDSNNVWAAGGTDSGNKSYITYTNDGGKNWNTQKVDDKYSNGIIDISMADAKKVFAVGPYAILRTTDKGTDWKRIKELPEHCNGAFALDSQRVWFAIDYGEILYSTDGGNTLLEPDSVTSQHAANGFALTGVGFMANGKNGSIVGTNLTGGTQLGIILTSSDGGKNWTEKDYPLNVGLRRVNFAGMRK